MPPVPWLPDFRAAVKQNPQPSEQQEERKVAAFANGAKPLRMALK